MKKLILLILGSIIAATAVGQIQQDQRTFGLVEYRDKGDTLIIKKLKTIVVNPVNGMKLIFMTPPDTARLFIPNDGKKYRVTATFTEVVTVVDTLLKETLDDRSTRITTVNMWQGGKTGLVANTFTAVSNLGLTSLASAQFTGHRIEFWSERFNTPPTVHGKVEVWIDDVKVAELNQGLTPLVTDFSRNKPSFKYDFPQGGLHKIELRTQAGANQYILDAFKVYEFKERTQ